MSSLNIILSRLKLLDYQYIDTTGTTALAVNTNYVVNAAVTHTLTLPTGAVQGDVITVLPNDAGYVTNNVTLDRNGSKIAGKNEDYIVDVDNFVFRLVYIDATEGWIIHEIAETS